MGRIEYRVALCTVGLAVAIAGAVLARDVSAQAPPARTAPAAPKAAPPAAATPAAAATQQVAMPDADKIVLLLRSTLLTLNDALQTGNYTVLRDMGASGFRAANTAAKLTQIFAPLAAQAVDLTAAAVLAPQLTEMPTIDPQRQMLRLKGFFPGQPQQINFEVLYEPVAGHWRLFGISVAMTQAAPQARAPEPTPAGDSLQARAGGSPDAPKGKPPTRKPN
jgi:hypothetical protein